MMKSITLPALLLTLATTCLAQPVWKADDHRSLELLEGDTTLVRFIVDAAPRDPHFEVLATADGRNTVWVAPPDHVWHYGMWFSWKYVNGVNFWETDPKTGKQQGLNRIEDAAIDSQPDGDTAVIRYRELAHPDPAGPAVLEDAVRIEIRRPADGNGPQVTWHVTTTALADVILDRTPLPGEPDGRNWGGYAGFSWRGAKEFTDVRFTDSEGRREMDIHRQHARWVNITGALHEKPAGLLLIDHPANPGHPVSWYLFCDPKLPFWFANPARVQPKPISLNQGEKMKHSYRLILHDGSLGEDAITKAVANFGSRE
jgi:hypothetical protein